MKGFIVHSFAHHRKPIVYMVGRLENGKTFGVTETRHKPGLYLRESECPGSLEAGDCEFTTMDGEPLKELCCSTTREVRAMAVRLGEQGIRVYEGDLTFQDQFFISRGLRHCVKLEGNFSSGRHVDRIYQDPEFTPEEFFPALVLLSLDIETSPGGSIRAISMIGENRWKKIKLRCVLLVQGQERSFPREVVVCSGEKELLQDFRRRLLDLDPDIITGWNVQDFDFPVIARRFEHHQIPLTLGRSSRPGVYLPAEGKSKGVAILPGRQLVDAMWLLRASPDQYEDYRLETVARQLLGEGKDITSGGEDKLRELEQLYQDDPAAYALYCLKDAELVLKILEKTKLLDLTLKRAMLTGVNLENAWTSIRPFEHLYMEHLRKRRMIAPSLGVDQAPAFGAPGGLVFAPPSRLYRNILIFDFKSLYPSIIRTFNIDPLSFIFADESAGKNENFYKYIKAPNGACFSRTRGILPEIVDHFFAQREAAKKEKDHIASYVYKILMNSFYGVLGTPGCRFASAFYSGAITGLGQHLLIRSRELLTDRGYEVLYGDTDSLFVQGKAPGDWVSLEEEGCRLRDLVNQFLNEYIQQEYGVESRLELEFEKIYSHLFIPPIRSRTENKGRTKGYAGFILQEKEPEDKNQLLEIKGMEAIRSDWTPLAHEFQTGLLLLIFQERKTEALESYIRNIVESLFSGELDHKLVYKKNLRRPLSSYTKSRTPQVKAAEQLGWKNRKGRVQYVMTQNGPEPLELLKSPPDYDHYLDKQLKPIAYSLETVTLEMGLNLEALFSRSSQPWLF